MSHIKQYEHLKIQLETIKSATNNFANEHLIGHGGFGKVFKGEINHSKGQHTIVALKRLDRLFGQGESEFWKEIMLLSRYRHENIVSLLGYCDDSGEKILAYDYASKKSLDLYLNKDELTWVQRLKICVGAARGLAYLHTPVDTQPTVLHRDIKSSNILLDENWNAKISDFGPSKFTPANKNFTYLMSNAVGTFGYCDPLYVETGLLTKESDVYSFGVVLFEVLCGRLCINNKNDKHWSFIGLVRQGYEKNQLDDIIIGNIKDEINPHSLKEFTKVAYQCLNKDREERPLRINVVKALESALKCLNVGNSGDTTPIAGILKVTVLRGSELNRENPFVILKLTNSSLTSMKKTSVKYATLKPEWNEEFTLYVEDPSTQDLEIWIMSMYMVDTWESLGCSELKLSGLTPEEPHTHSQGDITVQVWYKPYAYYTCFEDENPVQKAPTGTPRGGGLLVVIIHEGYIHGEERHSNPYASLLFQGELRKTMCIKTNLYPKWEEEFTYMLEEPPMNQELHLQVINTRWYGLKEQSMGYVKISLADVVKQKRINKKYDLLSLTEEGWVCVELEWRTSD